MYKLRTVVIIISCLFILQFHSVVVQSNTTIYWEASNLNANDQYFEDQFGILNTNTGIGFYVGPTTAITLVPDTTSELEYPHYWILFVDGIVVNYYSQNFGAERFTFFDQSTNSTYVVDTNFDVWRYNSSYTINNDRVSTWFNLTSYFLVQDFELFPNTGRIGYQIEYNQNLKQFLLFGGTEVGLNFQDTWIFDLVTMNWTLIATPVQPGYRQGYSLEYSAERQRYYLFGGWDQVTNQHFADLWEFDPNQGTWEELISNTSPVGRTDSVLGYHPLYDGIIVYGGRIFGETLSHEIWFYDFASNWWIYLTSESSGSSLDSTTRLTYRNGQMFIQDGDKYILYLDLQIIYPETSISDQLLVASTETTRITVSENTGQNTVTITTTISSPQATVTTTQTEESYSYGYGMLTLVAISLLIKRINSQYR